MDKKIAILRGINVGGKRKILMAELRAMMEKIGFSKVSTYIQSGNVFFEYERKMDKAPLEQKIKTAIHNYFGYDVPVIVISPKELQSAIAKNPFYKEGISVEHLHLTFLSDTPSNENKSQTETYDYSPDQFVIDGKNVYIYCERKYHQSKLTNTFFEKKLKVKATTRNWKTVLKLWELSGEQ